MKKINLLILFGGKSSEHSVSVWSANNIIKVLSMDKYILHLVYIDKKGNWFEIPNNFEIKESVIKGHLNTFNRVCLFSKDNKGQMIDLKSQKTKDIDVCFPILHGLNGEDGSIQGLLQIFNIKCVGSSILGSSINMDKVIQKKILQCSGIKTAKFISFKKEEVKDWSFEKVVKIIKKPFFVKPANTGSSLGINKVKTKAEFLAAIKEAFKYDNKIIIEESIVAREIECSIIGNGKIFVSLPGEIIPQEEFYTFQAKYSKNSQTKLIIPANLPKKTIKDIQCIAASAYTVLECSGFARVDLFLTSQNEIYINEINTIPGFTNISMFPKLLEMSNLNQTQIINLLINFSIKN